MGSKFFRPFISKDVCILYLASKEFQVGNHFSSKKKMKAWLHLSSSYHYCIRGLQCLTDSLSFICALFFSLYFMKLLFIYNCLKFQCDTLLCDYFQSVRQILMESTFQSIVSFVLGFQEERVLFLYFYPCIATTHLIHSLSSPSISLSLHIHIYNL